MTYQEILAYIDINIRQKTLPDSIPPEVVARALDECAALANRAYPIPYYPTEGSDGEGVIDSNTLVGVDVIEIRGAGFILQKGVHYTKGINDSNVVFIDENSIPPNLLVLLQTK